MGHWNQIESAFVDTEGGFAVAVAGEVSQSHLETLPRGMAGQQSLLGDMHDGVAAADTVIVTVAHTCNRNPLHQRIPPHWRTERGKEPTPCQCERERVAVETGLGTGMGTRYSRLEERFEVGTKGGFEEVASKEVEGENEIVQGPGAGARTRTRVGNAIVRRVAVVVVVLRGKRPRMRRDRLEGADRRSQGQRQRQGQGADLGAAEGPPPRIQTHCLRKREHQWCWWWPRWRSHRAEIEAGSAAAR